MKDDELRHWQEVEHHLTELTQQPGWGALVEYAHYRMAPIKRRVLNPDHAVYGREDYVSDTAWCGGIHDLLDSHKTVSKMVAAEIGRRREMIAPVDDAA